MQQDAQPEARLRRVTGSALAGAAVVLIAFNLLFPRAADPLDVPSVVTMMADNQTLRQVSFLALTVGLWSVTAGLVGIARSLSSTSAAILARTGASAAVVGATLFTVAAGLGMAATGAAAEWVAAGADTTGAEYAVAAALNRADDSVWFLSIIAYWGGLALLGAAMASSASFPRWMGAWLGVVGVVGAAVVGLPLALGVESAALFLAFGAVGMLTALWALVTGIWTVRRVGSRHDVDG